jgi:hypothetical protein
MHSTLLLLACLLSSITHNSENGNITFLQNIDKYNPYCTAPISENNVPYPGHVSVLLELLKRALPEIKLA